jgi:hypothetical protein
MPEKSERQQGDLFWKKEEPFMLITKLPSEAGGKQMLRECLMEKMTRLGIPEALSVILPQHRNLGEFCAAFFLKFFTLPAT